MRRPTTNTPLQALVTLNETQFMNAARALGAEIIDEREGRSLRDNMVRVFRRCTSRKPSPDELEILEGAFKRHRLRYQTTPDQARALCLISSDVEEPVDRWAAAILIASTILNLDETLSRP